MSTAGPPTLAKAPAVLAIAVSDTGIGIGKVHEQRIFEAFVQGDGTTARLYGGTGLGLSISRELSGLLGGEITVSSAAGEGSVFTVFLPVSLSPAVAPAPFQADLKPDRAAPPAAGPSIGASGQHLAGLRVLVVDDDFRNVFALTALLERGNAQVTTAESGPAALAALERLPEMDLVLMDIMMPVMDGYAAIRAIRALDQFKDLPIIALTGKVVAGERDRCLDAGANAYVPKPVNTAELVSAIGAWLPESVQPTP